MLKTTQQKFKKILSRPYEDTMVIKEIESILSHKRGYVIRIPKPGSDVIHLVSGGLDSIVTWAILMEDYKLRVHPISIKTWQGKHESERKSIKFYSKLFKERYPGLYVDPFEITYPSSPPEIKQRLTKNLKDNVNPEVLKKSYDQKTNSFILTRKFLYPAFVTFPAARAALFFEMQRNTKIRIISESILPSDGEFNESQTLTSLRGAMIAMCTFTNDYSWQIFSPCFEKEIPSLYFKKDLIRWANKHKLPLEHTYSCLMNYKHNCGECLNCNVRKNAFAEAHVKDNTPYENNIRSFPRYFFQQKKKIQYTYNKLVHKVQISINHYTQ
jgi:7-cyano-7-deazaguanine synthase in queuosine biosynthesis